MANNNNNNNSVEYNFIGSGWAFRPDSGIGVNGQGNLALTYGEQDIAKSIFIILSTAPGERVMRTDFGCGIHDLVFSTPGPQIYGLIAYQVSQALGRWEPRIEVIDVRVSTDKFAQERLIIDVDYRVRQTNSERNLVYPFYVIPRGQD
jgi:phage baseplate assembly protein W